MIKICIIGLGYVGLPVCLKISKKYKTIGFDINQNRINNLRKKIDTNKEYKKVDFNKNIYFTSNVSKIKNCNFYIICVPTPITNKNIPDLTALEKSFDIISKILKKNDIVVLESTVYPGLTSKYSKFLEKKCNLIDNNDFFLCYSPERINPGDKRKNLAKINKVFAIKTNNKKIINVIKRVYKNLCKKLIISKFIEETETAKVIENIQRDVNIAIFNEILIICEKLNINFSEVIRLARTKWNFINFKPGLVGGHCLPVDPFYLSYIAKKKNLKTLTTLAGRETNNNMEKYVINLFKEFIKSKNIQQKNCRVLLVGLSYKYGVADIRNSINVKIYNKIKKINKKTYCFDPFVNNKVFKLKTNLRNINGFDVVIFLSKGKLYEKLYKKIFVTRPDIILDPFYYYKN